MQYITPEQVADNLLEYAFERGVHNMDKLVKDQTIREQGRAALLDLLRTGEVDDWDEIRRNLHATGVLPKSGKWNFHKPWLPEEGAALWIWVEQNWPSGRRQMQSPTEAESTLPR